MALNKAVITPAEADVILAQETSWLAEADAVKEHHIGLASVHMQGRWKCLDIDWADDSTISSDIKEACAYFALASYNGNLYQSTASTEDISGVVIEQTDQLGSLKSTTKWAEKGSKDVNPLQYPNALMGFECSPKSGLGSVKLTRV